jgi:hypothetical protein
VASEDLGPHVPSPALNWSPPELLRREATVSDYTTASDVYGVAMILSEIIQIEVPLEKYMNRRTRIPREEWLELITTEGARPVLPENLPHILRRAIEAAWHPDPMLRPSAERLLHVIEHCIAVVERDV